MYETVWPRVRTLVRLAAFAIGVVVIAWAALGIFNTPLELLPPGDERTQVVIEEVLIIGVACFWMLLATKI